MIRLEKASSNVKILQDICINIPGHKLHRFLPEANNFNFNRSLFLSLYIDEMIILETHLFELLIETKFEVYDLAAFSAT